jgi:hypothetical protein
MEIRIPKPHKNQDYILNNARRFNVVKCGRRFGKTTIIKRLSKPALKDGWYVGIWMPTYKDLAEVWKDLNATFFPAIKKKNEQLKQIELKSGGVIDFWSMEDPNSGRGRKYHRVIMDEFAKAKKNKEAWQETIRPTLTDFKGDAWFLSTPKGKNNYFFQLELLMAGQPDWAFFKFTTYDNPKIDPLEIDSAKNQLDDLTFRQEYLAEDVDANDRPYLYAFSEKIHVIDSFSPNPHLPLLFSYDFNKEPMTVLVAQQTNLKEATVFDEIELREGSTPEITAILLAKYIRWKHNIDVTGDATGRNRSALTVGNLNHYRIIKDMLSLVDRNLLVPKQNMAHRDSRVLCNSVLQNASFRITKKCQKTIMDCIYASVDEDGELIKTQDQGRHFFDNFRYLIHTFYPDFIKNPNKYKHAA